MIAIIAIDSLLKPSALLYLHDNKYRHKYRNKYSRKYKYRYKYKITIKSQPWPTGCWPAVGCGFSLMDDLSLMDPPSPSTFLSLSLQKHFSPNSKQMIFSLLLNVTQTCVDKHLMRIYSKCFHKRVLRHL